MACPKCSSRNVRKTEPGLLLDDYICNACGHGYEKLDAWKAAKGTVIGVGLIFGITLPWMPGGDDGA